MLGPKLLSGAGQKATPLMEQVYLITRLGTLDARPPDKALDLEWSC